MTLAQQLPMIVVILPLLASPLCVIAGNGGRAKLLMLLVVWICTAISVQLLSQVVDSGPIDYQFGGWEPPWGIAYHLDLLSVFVLLLVCGISALVLSGGHKIPQEVTEDKVSYFCALILLALSGFFGIILTADAFNLFVFLEISSLASYALISMGKDRRALRAAFQYLIMGSIGASFILVGIGFLYMMTGTLNMQDMSERLPALTDTSTVRAGFAFFIVGIGLKLALFPLHFWLPNAYTFAPAIISALLAGTATKVAVYMLLRVTLGIFGINFALEQMPLDRLLLILGGSGVLFASMMAVMEDNVKRLLAYSSVAQLGYMAMALGLASAAGVTAAMLHLFNHALMKSALFLAIVPVVIHVGGFHLHHLRGLGRTMPWTMAAFSLAGLSLIGVPLTAGFVSKWYLLSSALEQHLWALVVLILIGSLMALIYMWKMLEEIYFKQPENPNAAAAEAPIQLLIPLWILVAANIYFGIDTDLTVGLAEQATQALLGAHP
ncbi:MAG: monovalent cation/H+ antiporter subunit D family protein [Motiliproteus sp.]|nr:monovalent cation/H+ antiporter subunit D family protein [Motiliproteus sp.]MCW9051600.1 monovalent cation/H+ antiporter subunit D family protein [Motiliproteus sp.]